MKKLCCLILGVLCGISGSVQGQDCPPLPFTCPYPTTPQQYGYCTGFQDSDSALLTFFVNPISRIELHDKSLEFSNCGEFGNILCEEGLVGSCVLSSFTALTNEASCTTPKKIVGTLDECMPGCTQLGVIVGTPAESCQGECRPESGFCGANQCGVTFFGDGLGIFCNTSVDLLRCIYCPFIDCDIDITYIFQVTICQPPGTFQRVFTLSFMDDDVGDCCGIGIINNDFGSACPCP